MEDAILNKQISYAWECPKCGGVNHESYEFTKDKDVVMCEHCLKEFKAKIK